MLGYPHAMYASYPACHTFVKLMLCQKKREEKSLVKTLDHTICITSPIRYGLYTFTTHILLQSTLLIRYIPANPFPTFDLRRQGIWNTLKSA